MKKSERKIVEFLILIEIDIIVFIFSWTWLAAYAETFCRK